jgi:hypothetical protein
MNRQISLAFFLVLSFTSWSYAQNEVKLVKTKINDAITVSIPADFTIMSDDIYARKYGAYRRPLAMYTSPNGLVDFGINQAMNHSPLAKTSAEWSEEDLKIIKDMYKSSIAGMHSEVTFLQDKIEEINKKKFIVLEFVGKVKEEEDNYISSGVMQQYSYIQYAVEDAKILIFNFTCPAKVKSMWQNAASQIMHSIKVGKEK